MPRPDDFKICPEFEGLRVQIVEGVCNQGVPSLCVHANTCKHGHVAALRTLRTLRAEMREIRRLVAKLDATLAADSQWALPAHRGAARSCGPVDS